MNRKRPEVAIDRPPVRELPKRGEGAGLTVGELRHLLAGLPAHAQVWIEADDTLETLLKSLRAIPGAGDIRGWLNVPGQNDPVRMFSMLWDVEHCRLRTKGSRVLDHDVTLKAYSFLKPPVFESGEGADYRSPAHERYRENTAAPNGGDATAPTKDGAA